MGDVLNPGLSDILSFWGKAQPGDGASQSWHPAVYHLLDVAAVAEAILQNRPVTRSRAAKLLGLEVDEAQRLLVMLVALHDIGKFAPAFQAKSPEHWPPVLGQYQPGTIVNSVHTNDGYLLWYSEVSSRLADRLWVGGQPVLEALAPGIFGHHGRPIKTSELRSVRARWKIQSDASITSLASVERFVEHRRALHYH